MNTKYGLRGSLNPAYPFSELIEDLDIYDMKVHVEHSALEIGFDNEADESKARNVVNQITQLWSLAHDIKITIELNQKWHMKSDDEKNISIELHEEIKMHDHVRVNQVSISAKAHIVKSDLFDSSSFKNNLPLLKKSLVSIPLQKALIYFHEEVLDSGKPLYGIYKAVEELCLAVGGRDKLAALADQSANYVSDLMQTTQTMRHARTPARRIITDGECRQRARVLIEAYTNSI